MKNKYKGYNLNPDFCDPAKDWGKHKGFFRIEFTQKTIFNETYAGCIAEAKKYIDTLYVFDFTSEEKIKKQIISMFSAGYENLEWDDKQLNHFVKMIFQNI